MASWAAGRGSDPGEWIQCTGLEERTPQVDYGCSETDVGVWQVPLATREPPEVCARKLSGLSSPHGPHWRSTSGCCMEGELGTGKGGDLETRWQVA